MSTPLLDRIAARSAGPNRRYHVLDLATEPPTRTVHVVAPADVPAFERALQARGPLVSHWSENAWTDIPQSPFTRRALSGELPAKVIR